MRIRLRVHAEDRTPGDPGRLLDLDLDELRRAKLALYRLARKQPDGVGELLDGLVNLVDEIQDYLADDLGLPEHEVFVLADEVPRTTVPRRVEA